MDDVYLDQGFWNRILGRFWLWRRLVGGHWECWLPKGSSHGWAKIDMRPWGGCRGPWESDGHWLVYEENGRQIGWLREAAPPIQGPYR
jgi:hypothetical protein